MVANRTSFETLDYRQYVAFGVLEPGGFGAARRDGSARTPFTRHFVVLNRDAAYLQLGNLLVDVFYLPERLAGFGRPGIGRRLEEARCVFSKLVHDSAGLLRARFKT